MYTGCVLTQDFVNLQVGGSISSARTATCRHARCRVTEEFLRPDLGPRMLTQPHMVSHIITRHADASVSAVHNHAHVDTRAVRARTLTHAPMHTHRTSSHACHRTLDAALCYSHVSALAGCRYRRCLSARRRSRELRSGARRRAHGAGGGGALLLQLRARGHLLEAVGVVLPPARRVEVGHELRVEEDGLRL